MVVAVSFWRDLYPKSPLPIFFLYNPTKNFFEFPIHSELIRRFWKSSKYIHYYRRSPIVHVSWIFFSVLAVYHFDFLSFPFLAHWYSQAYDLSSSFPPLYGYQIVSSYLLWLVWILRSQKRSFLFSGIYFGLFIKFVYMCVQKGERAEKIANNVKNRLDIMFI